MPWTVTDPKTGRLADVVCRRFNLSGTGLRYNVELVDYSAPAGQRADRRIGQLHYGRFDGWVAISNADHEDLCGFRMVDGFGARRAAIKYLLRVGDIMREFTTPLGSSPETEPAWIPNRKLVPVDLTGLFEWMARNRITESDDSIDDDAADPVADSSATDGPIPAA